MKWSIRLGRLFGIDVYLHFTFLLFIGFIGFSQWQHNPHMGAVALEVGFFLAIFTCVLLHEFGHALTARRFGVGTRDITLLPIGGLARLDRIPEKPAEELWVAIAGPAVNVVIAAVLFIGLQITAAAMPLHEYSLMGGSFLHRVMVVNVIIVAFNMLPAFPMDGGRVLRAFLAMRMDYARATAIAARIGQMTAVGFALVGFYTNPMLIFIAFFVWVGAAGEANMASVKSALAGVPVSRAMITNFRSLETSDPLQHAVDLVIKGSQNDFPVTENGKLCGILQRAALIKALAERGPQAMVGAVTERQYTTVEASAPLDAALALLNESDGQLLPVMERGKLAGLLTGENLSEFVLIQAALKRPRT